MSNLIKYFNDYKFKSLFFRNFLLISLIAIIPFIILSLVFVSGLLNSFNNHTMEISEKQLEKIQQQTDSNLSEVNKISSKLTLDESINNFMIFENLVPDEVITDKLKYISTTFEYIDSIYIYSNVTDYTLSVGNANFDKKLVKDLFNRISGEKYLYTFIENDNYYTDYLTLVKPVYITQTVPLGALYINISTYHLEELMNSKDSSNFTYILDENNNIICGKNIKSDSYAKELIVTLPKINKMPYRHTNKNKSYIICSAESSIPGKKYVSVSVADNSFLSDNNATLILIFVLIILIDILISLLITIQTYTPITHILDVLNQNYSPAIKKKAFHIKHQNELSYIIDSLNKLQTDKLKISNDLAVTLDELNKMHYMLMNSQINSHFLSNTLQSISWLAYGLTDSPNKVTQSLNNLGELYRLLTGTDSFLITLNDELEYTKKYLQIMQLKYDNIFTVNYSIDDTVLNAKIPKLSLQPILENSFIHGFDLNSDNNIINISVHQKKDYVEITISDNGIGMSEEDLKNLKMTLKSRLYTTKIGIANINNRFNLIFGDNFGVTVNSALYEGTSIHLTIPNDNKNNNPE